MLLPIANRADHLTATGSPWLLALLLAFVSLSACAESGCTKSGGATKQATTPGNTPKQAIPPGQSTKQQDALLTRLAFGSCAHQEKPQPIWDAVLRHQPQVFAFLGDNVYADTLDMNAMRQAYARLGAVPGYRALTNNAQVIATWDDHDYGLNDAGVEYPKKTESAEIFLDFFEEPIDSPRRARTGIYTAYLYGPADQRVQVILLDLRTFRTRLRSRARTEAMHQQHMGPYIPTTEEGSTMMGEAQWAWLEAQLKVSAKVRLIASGTQFLAEGGGWETWSNMPRERERMFALLAKARATGVVFISGDTHWAELSMEKRPGLYPLYDLTSSGLTEVWAGVAPNQRRVGAPFLGANFGTVTIQWSKDPEILLEARDGEGKVRLGKALRLSELSQFD